jgi:hypothetical protein
MSAGATSGVVKVTTPADSCRVRDIKVEKLALCGAGWQPARRLATAAVWCKRGRWPIDNRPQLTKLPHNGTCALRTTYAQIPPVLLMNCAGLHFLVAHPLLPARLQPMWRSSYDGRIAGGDAWRHAEEQSAVHGGLVNLPAIFSDKTQCGWGSM